ncbi:MutT/Nudix family protein [uncultured Leptolyngbya sp.]|uniref:Bis(5'-nucleosyl)-tetraphosphatase [asymmetrical] n=1 Tax=uncultured Leptolyngbya sp. TaxID=332963 RepID=A0A6J4MU50_9CYAN|nr:MutT/Nudix family protein [uncultured Leptolyngbya sp.]
MADSTIAKDEAFGIVPILHTDTTDQFLLIQHHAGHWGFPKGHADPGESALQAACREFLEETGIADYSLIEGISFSEQYPFTRGRQKFEKTVIYFLAWVQSATVHCQEKEIQAYVWADYEQAIARLSFDGAKQVLREVQQYLKSAS